MIIALLPEASPSITYLSLKSPIDITYIYIYILPIDEDLNNFLAKFSNRFVSSELVELYTHTFFNSII